MCAFRFHFWGRKVNWNQASHVRASSAVTSIKANLEWEEHELFAQSTVFKGWLQKAAELGQEEAKLHAGLPKHLQQILTRKKLFWKHILVSLDYGDAKIIDEIISGFSLTGWASESGVFDKRSELRAWQWSSWEELRWAWMPLLLAAWNRPLGQIWTAALWLRLRPRWKKAGCPSAIRWTWRTTS